MQIDCGATVNVLSARYVGASEIEPDSITLQVWDKSTMKSLGKCKITKTLDENTPIDTIYLDCRKAFDSVPIKRLILKVEAVGIGGKLLAWVKAFLTDREQRVHLRGQYSPWCRVLSGVPQGNVLGPVLFLIYINDIVMNINSTIKVFADDAKIYRAMKSQNDVDVLQGDLNQLTNWSRKWLLKFNEQKCKVMHFWSPKCKSGILAQQCHTRINQRRKGPWNLCN